ncbi:MAG: iron complex outermembrane receptor protein [Saprospiraceae bacterium]|jgi:iron complex outermembrane receptor protein
MQVYSSLISLLSFILLIPSIYGQEADSLNNNILEELVIKDYAGELRNEAGIGTSVRINPAITSTAGVAGTLQQIPGMFIDGSTGDVFSRVHTRGISLSAEDDIGWYYNSLQEDGLPVTAIQFQQFSPDFFLRPDISHQRVEVIRGGKSGVLSQSGPAASINYISESPKSTYTGVEKLTAGVYAGGRPMIRMEGYHGGPIGKKGWAYDYSYFYRYDKGPREIQYAANDGGQMKLGIHKRTKSGVFSLKGKWLDDRNHRYTGVPSTNWSNPEPAFGMSFQNSALLVPGIDEQENNIGNRYTYNPANGIRSQEKSLQFNMDQKLGDWRLIGKAKYSNKDVDWQTTIGGQPLGLENFLTYFISGDEFPAGVTSFTEVATGTQLAQVNNLEAFGVFQGLPPGYEYLSGSLPNDAIMASGAWKKDDSIDELMADIQLKRSFDNAELTLGVFGAQSDVDIFTNASFIYSTYEPESRLLSVSLDNPGEPSRLLSDANGFSNYGALFYEGAAIKVNQYALYGNLSTDISEALTIDGGLRYQFINHNGTKDLSAPISSDGGLDGNPLTSYDNGFLTSGGTNAIDDFDYNYLSFSLGANYKLSNATTSYARFSSSHKAPELNFYLDNFSNQEIPSDFEIDIQDITQLEVGIAHATKKSSLMVAGFWSKLSDVPYTDFVFDEELNQIYYTPTQLNGSTTIGLEAEWEYELSDPLQFFLSGTFQKGRLDDFTVYNPQGSIDPADDEIADFEGNKLPHTPVIMLKTGLVYETKAWSGSIAWNYMGSRYGNVSNAFKLPAYGTLDINLGYKISNKWSTSLRCTNLTSTGGLQNFFGPNEFGSNSNAADQSYISANPNGSFVVFPIMPRAIYLSFQYAY